MNFLAHAFLSFNYDQVLVGNMISDFVKGKARYDFPPEIQHGIELHRRIDIFTDAHAITAEIKNIFKPAAGGYAPVFGDVAYDYFLANDPEQFPDEKLSQFALSVYKTLTAYETVLPLRFRDMLPHMRKHDWLSNYKTHYGIERSFEGIVKRAAYLKDSKPAFTIFIEHSDNLQRLYQQFFPEVKAFAFEQLQSLMNQSQ